MREAAIHSRFSACGSFAIPESYATIARTRSSHAPVYVGNTLVPTRKPSWRASERACEPRRETGVSRGRRSETPLELTLPWDDASFMHPVILCRMTAEDDDNDCIRIVHVARRVSRHSATGTNFARFDGSCCTFRRPADNFTASRSLAFVRKASFSVFLQLFLRR